MKKRLESLIAEYGAVALVVYLSMSVLVYTGFLIAIQTGFRPEGAASTLGSWGLAWVGLKATQIFRVPAAIALTPLVARVVRRSPQSE